MGRWLDRLKNIENTPNKHCQNRQKAINETFGSFVSASNGDFQKNLPAIWDVMLRNGNAVSPMVVIDPARESNDQFMAGLIDRFGSDKVLSAVKREII